MKLTKLFSLLFLSLSLMIATPLYAGSILQPLTDTTNSGIINTKMLGHDSFSNVDATVENGIAIFSGQVPSQIQVNQLIRIAHSVSGIRGVDVSRLRVGR